MMKEIRRLFLFVSAVILLAGCAFEPAGEPSHVKVLMIGNSFSISTLRYLPRVAQDCGVKLDLGSLYIGGCSLERHATNIVAECAGKKGTYLYNRITDNGKKYTSHGDRLIDVLRRVKWDVVTIQQASHLSWKADSYDPWGDRVIETVHRLAPQAKIVVQETWSYTPFDKRLKKWKITPDEMYDKLAAAYGKFAAARGLSVIRMGAAVQAWRARLPVEYGDHSFGGDVVGGGRQKPQDHFKRNLDLTWSLNSDAFHLNDKGEYLQALVWAAKLVNADVESLEFRPDGVSESEAKLMRQIAQEVAK